jgi:FHA domain
MDNGSHDRDRAVPPAEDLLVSFNGQRVIRRAADGEFIIGREVPPSHMQIDHPAISRLHIRLVPGARWVLIDYDSRNGVYLQGRRIDYETPIADCMTVHLGAPDGVPVAFHFIGSEQHTPAASVDEADPNIGRTGRAVLERCAALGLSPRELNEGDVIDPQEIAQFIKGYAWPRPATCAALEHALAWPTDTLEAIRQGQPVGEITDVITPEVRSALLVDAAALSLAEIAAAIAELPPNTEPGFTAQAEPLRRRLAGLERSLAASAEHEEALDLLNAIARVYTRLLAGTIDR